MANWIKKRLEKKPFRVVSVALANKLASIAWVVLTRERKLTAPTNWQPESGPIPNW
jgi:transposase